jgi:hypothetical protein
VSDLVFLPLSPAELAAWAGGGHPGPEAGFAMTPGMAAAFGFDDPAGEDASHTALCIASLAGLLRHGVRLVAVAELPWQARDEPELAEFGAVRVAGAGFTAVTALFGEGSDPAAVAALAAALDGVPLAEAWERDDVGTLLSDGALLWYGPAEWPQLLGS